MEPSMTTSNNIPGATAGNFFLSPPWKAWFKAVGLPLPGDVTYTSLNIHLEPGMAERVDFVGFKFLYDVRMIEEITPPLQEVR